MQKKLNENENVDEINQFFATIQLNISKNKIFYMYLNKLNINNSNKMFFISYNSLEILKLIQIINIFLINVFNYFMINEN